MTSCGMSWDWVRWCGKGKCCGKVRRCSALCSSVLSCAMLCSAVFGIVHPMVLILKCTDPYYF